MALLTPVSLSDAVQIGRSFGLDVVDCQALSAGSVNSNFRLTTADDKTYFGRIYEEQDESGARAEAQLLRELATAGVPVALTLPPRDPSQIPRHHGKPVAIYPWIGGEELRGRQIRPEHCDKLGQALAKVHAASDRLTQIPNGRFGFRQLRERLKFITDQAPQLRDVVKTILEALERHAARGTADLPSGLTHGDLFRDNVLWREGEIRALLDFESACHGVFIYDLMVCVLAWCYADDFDLPCVQALVQGYETVRPLTDAERAAYVSQGALGCLRFATTRLTDFELRCEPGQTPTRDYRRFLERMQRLEAGALDSVFSTTHQGAQS